MNPNYITYLKAHNCSEKTIGNYLHYVQQALDYIGKHEANITYMDLMAWSLTFKDLAVNSRNIRTAAVRNYFTFLTDIGAIHTNPAEKFKREKVRDGDTKQKPYIEAQWLRDMVNACGTLRDKAIVLLYATTGLRVSELTGITIDDYNNLDGENNRELTIVGKGNKKRKVYIVDEVKEAIDRYLASKPERHCDYLFVSMRGNKIATNNLNGTIKKIARDAGLPCWEQMSNHVLRSAYATTKNEQGVPLTTIQKAMGHSKIETTMIYIKNTQHNINASMQDMAF